MNEWLVAASEVGQGIASPLAMVPALEALTDAEVLAFPEAVALAVLEVSRGASTAMEALQALAMEAVARREAAEVEDERCDFRERGLRFPGSDLSGDDLAAATLAPILHLSPRAAELLLGDVRVLVGELPETFAMVRAGRLDLARARVVAQAAGAVAPELLTRFDDVLTHPERGRRRYRLRVPDLATPELRRRATQVAADVDPASALQRAADARADRFVWVKPGAVAGVSSWSASLPSEDSLAMWAAIEELAGEYLRADRDCTVGRARAEALTSLVLGRATVTAHVDLTVPLYAWPSTPEGAPGTTPTGETTSETASETNSSVGGTPTNGVGATSTTRVGATSASGQTLTTGTIGATGPEGFDRPRSPLEIRWQVCGDTEIEVRRLRLVHSSDWPDRRHTEQPVDDAHATPPGPPSDPTDAGQPAASEAPTGTAATGAPGTPAAPAAPGTPAATAAPGTPAAPAAPGTPTAPGLTPLLGWRVGVHHFRVGFVLADAVAALLADPDTRLRLHGAHPDTGAVVTHDPTIYRPGAALARAVRARDGHCRFPSCSVDAARCQLDHITPFPFGPTSLDNLACLCLTHHRYKTHGRWGYQLHADATTTWTSPLGRSYTTEPDDPAHRAA